MGQQTLYLIFVQAIDNVNKLRKQMMKYSFIIMVCLLGELLLIPLGIKSQLSIIESGQYFLGGNLIETGTAISISADNVILDLRDHIIAGSTGIFIDSNVSDVIIRGGFILSTADHGVSISESCNSIELSDIVISGCPKRAIELLGTSANPIDNIFMENISIDRCATSTAFADSVFFMNYVRNLTFLRSRIVASGNSFRDIDLLHIENSMKSQFLDSNLTDNQGTSLIGANLIDSDGIYFSNFELLNNCATDLSGSFSAFCLNGESLSHVFENCLVLTNSSLNVCSCFDIQENSVGNYFEACELIGNIGNNFSGFSLIGSGEPRNTHANIFKNCKVLHNIALGAGEKSLGFFIQGADNGTILNSLITNNLAKSGESVGILFDTTLGGRNWVLKNNQIDENCGGTDMDSYGVYLITGTGNFFTQNVAFNNGSLIGNQLNGLPSGSTTQVVASNLNSSSAPWTNIASVP